MSIRQTRRGYGYQDKYSLFIFLKYLLDKNLKKFFVDRSFGKEGYSVDIVVIPRSDDIEIIYEIKTGENFKKSIKEISHALEVLWNYQKYKSSIKYKIKCKFYIIVSSELSKNLDIIWRKLKCLQKNEYFFRRNPPLEN